MKKIIILSIISCLVYSAEAQQMIPYTETVGGYLPLQIADDPSNLIFGTTTYGRQIRLSRQNNTYYYDIGLDSNHELFITKRNSLVSTFKIFANGSVGIGTTNTGSMKLAVEGKIGARGIKVTLDAQWPDYVFNKQYKLRSLDSLESYINQFQHLPGIPSSEEIEKDNGIELGDMSRKL